MATAKKLPSGNWRVQVFSHQDGTGKRHYESFTAPTKREAELLAAEFRAKKDRREKNNLRVGDAIDRYITAKTGVLSPSTIKNYRQMQSSRYDQLNQIPIKKLSSEDLQLFVSDLAGKVSPKTVSNVYGLLISAVGLYAPDATFRVTLPKKAKRRPDAPTDDDVAALFRIASKNMQKAIALAAFGSLRRGEICALTFADLNGNVLHIDKDMVQDEHHKWVIKDIPKTEDSLRDVILPERVVALLGTGAPSDRIVPILPSTVTYEFTKIRNRLGTSLRFHDLRHYFASIGAVMGVPDTYLAAFGGWRPGSRVMKEVYQNKIIPISEQYARKMGSHFDEILTECNTECNTEIKKAAI